MKPVSALNVLAAGAALLLAACQPAGAPDAPLADAACNPAQRAEVRAARPALEAAAAEAARQSQGPGTPALWTLADEDTTIYILGTVHLLRPDLEWKSPEIAAAIAEADLIVFEADTTSPAAQRELTRFSISEGLFRDGVQLSSLLTDAELAELSEALQTVDLPVEALQPMRPWFAAINVSVKLMLDEGFDPEAGVEKVIERAAREHGARFAYLETVEDQLGGLAGLSDCEQVDFLMATAAGIGAGTEALDLLIDEWGEGDVTGLGLLMANPEMIGSQAIYDVMLTDRNERWVPQIIAMLDEPGTVLVAVGAGHLAGEDSVITMLRNEGLAVEGP